MYLVQVFRNKRWRNTILGGSSETVDEAQGKAAEQYGKLKWEKKGSSWYAMTSDNFMVRVTPAIIPGTEV